MTNDKIKKLLILNLPYILVGLFATNLGEAWRIAEDISILGFFNSLPIAFNNIMPSLYPIDLFIGTGCGMCLKLAVYLKSKKRKKI